MMFRTHIAFAVLCALLLISFLGPKSPVLFFVVFVLASAVPDIDVPRSFMGKRHRITSTVLNVLFGHRGFIHTIYPALGLFAVFYFLGYSGLGFAALLGYLSHLILDMLTPEGIRLFHPFLRTNVKGFIYTASLSEYLLQIVILAGIVWQVKRMVF